MAFHRVAVPNFASGLSIVTVSDGLLETGAPVALPLAGAVSVTQVSSDPTTVVVGTATNPGLTSAIITAEGGITIGQTLTTTSAVFNADATTLGAPCLLAVQPAQLRSYTISPFALASAVSVPDITNVIVVGQVAWAHNGNQLNYFNIHESTCQVTPNPASPTLIQSLRDLFWDKLKQHVAYITRPLAGNGKLGVQRVENGLPIGLPNEILLPTRPFDVELDPSGTRAYMMGDFGEVTWATINGEGIATVSGQFTLPGADRFEVVGLTAAEELVARSRNRFSFARLITEPFKIIYTKVSNVSLGQICAVLLGSDGVPAEAPVCEQNSTRPGPDSGLEVLEIAPAAIRLTRPAQRARP